MKRCANPRCKHNFTNDEKFILCERCRTKLAGNAKKAIISTLTVACVVATPAISVIVNKTHK